MDTRAEEIAHAIATAGAALLALPLRELPPVVFAAAGERADGDGPWVRLQLSAETEPAAVLVAWAAVLPEARAVGTEYDNYIQVDVCGVLDSVRVSVWSHFDGEQLVDAGNFLSLPSDARPHRLPLAALRGLAARRAVSCDA